MSRTLRNVSMAAAMLVLSAPLLSFDVQAKDSFMKVCSTKYKAAKAAGTPEGNMKWTDFMKTQCAADANAAAPAAAAAPAKKPAAATAAPAAPAATPAATPSGSFMKDCSAAWKAMKAANTVPAGMAWRDFVKGGCKTAAGTPAAAAPAPAAPATKAAVAPAAKVSPAEPAGTAADTAELKTVDKNGKPFTPAQMAAHKRARECGNQWRAAKAANQLPVGQKWPQYWSDCSKRMKAAGQ